MNYEEYTIIRKNLEEKEGKLYSLVDIAKHTGYTRTWIYNYIHDMGIKTIKIENCPARFQATFMREKDVIRIIRYATCEGAIKWFVHEGYEDMTLKELLLRFSES